MSRREGRRIRCRNCWKLRTRWTLSHLTRAYQKGRKERKGENRGWCSTWHETSNSKIKRISKIAKNKKDTSNCLRLCCERHSWSSSTLSLIALIFFCSVIECVCVREKEWRESVSETLTRVCVMEREQTNKRKRKRKRGMISALISWKKIKNIFISQRKWGLPLTLLVKTLIFFLWKNRQKFPNFTQQKNIKQHSKLLHPWHW